MATKRNHISWNGMEMKLQQQWTVHTHTVITVYMCQRTNDLLTRRFGIVCVCVCERLNADRMSNSKINLNSSFRILFWHSLRRVYCIHLISFCCACFFVVVLNSFSCCSNMCSSSSMLFFSSLSLFGAHLQH